MKEELQEQYELEKNDGREVTCKSILDRFFRNNFFVNNLYCIWKESPSMCPTIRIYNIYIKHGSIIYLRLSSLKDKKKSNKYNGKYIGSLDV